MEIPNDWLGDDDYFAARLIVSPSGKTEIFIVKPQNQAEIGQRVIVGTDQGVALKRYSGNETNILGVLIKKIVNI